MRIGILEGNARVQSSFIVTIYFILFILLDCCRASLSVKPPTATTLVSIPRNMSLSVYHHSLPGEIRLGSNETSESQWTKKWPSSKRSKVKVLSRKRRSVVQLAGMLRCVTGCNPLSYKGYGCYCGYMGAGYPMDEIDRCCLEHDWCYSHISCPQLLIYFIPYEWSCLGPGYPQCEIGNMAGFPADCSLQLCECDRAFARCVRKFPCPKSKLGCHKRTFLPMLRGRR